MNYFEMLALPCDGKEADNIENIRTKIDKWELNQRNAQNNATSGGKRAPDAIDNELLGMRKMLTDASFRKQQAEEAKKIRLTKVEAIIGVMTRCYTGSRNTDDAQENKTAKSVARPMVAKIASLMGLENSSVAERFRAANYIMVTPKVAKTDDFLMEESVMERINENLEMIRKHMASHPYEPMQEIASATNLYEYIAIMDGKSIADAGEYEEKQADELAAKLGSKMMEHTKNAPPQTWYKVIEATAKAQIMCDEKQREKYNNMLKLQSLKPFLDLLESIPTDMKLGKAFAEGCIREIQYIFPDEDQAIAIYNKFGKMPPESQYEKEDTRIATMCKCHCLNYNATREEAEKACCISCHEPLYVKCPKCGKMVPAVSDFCACGFFMKGRQSFAIHKLRFDTAVKNADLPKAQDEYNQAKACDPGQDGLSGMLAALGKLEKEIGKPIEEIKNELSAGRINAAREKIAALKTARPTVNVKQYEDRVAADLLWAAQEYEKLKHITNQAAGVETVARIIERVKDYEPALEWLRRHKPKQVQKVSKIEDSSKLSCLLQWEDDPENRFVSYTIVRKEGAKPRNVMDGVLIASEIKQTEYRDTMLAPGKVYVYAVFAVRGGTYSEPMHSPPIYLMKNISGVQVIVSEASCIISWRDIPGSCGVRVYRSEDGGTKYSVVCDCAKSTFRDIHVVAGKHYRYLFRTVWELLGKTYFAVDEVTREVSVEPKPPRIDLQLAGADPNGNCEVTWQKASKGEIYIVALNRNVTVVPDRVYSIEMLKRMGKIIAAAIPAAWGKYAWQAERGHQYQVAAFRSFGDEVVGGTTIRVSTVPPLKIDEVKTTILENTLKLYLQDVPSEVSKIFYKVTESDSICTEQMAIQNEINSIDKEKYQASKNGIKVENLPPKKLTVSLLARYGDGDGDDAYYSPAAVLKISNLPKKKVEYWIEWQKEGLLHKRRVRRNAKLHVRVEGDRIPDMALCCRNNGTMILNYKPGGAGIVQLREIAGHDKARKEEEYDIPEISMKGLPENTDIQLFLSPGEQKYFLSPMATDAGSRKMPGE